MKGDGRKKQGSITLLTVHDNLFKGALIKNTKKQVMCWPKCQVLKLEIQYIVILQNIRYKRSIEIYN